MTSRDIVKVWVPSQVSKNKPWFLGGPDPQRRLRRHQRGRLHPRHPHPLQPPRHPVRGGGVRPQAEVRVRQVSGHLQPRAVGCQRLAFAHGQAYHCRAHHFCQVREHVMLFHKILLYPFYDTTVISS